MKHLWPTADKQEAASRRQDSVKSPKNTQAVALERKGAEAWLSRLGPRTFTGAFAPFHSDFWAWYWEIRLKLLRGETLELDEMAALLIWGRGMGKSSNVEWCCIMEGALAAGGFVMYVSGTEKQAREHVAAIKNRLESSLIAEYYPGMSKPEIGAHGNQRGWRQDYLATQSGWGILPVGLDQGIRGGRKDDTRFSLIVLDDIDDHDDSPAAVEKKLDTISRTILPAGDADTIVLFAQNLIHEDSVLNQIYTRRSDVLADRKVFGPYKSFDDVELEADEVNAGKWLIRQATPTWEHFDMRAARLFLSRSGRKGFMAEYQHDFNDDKTEYVLKNWRDAVHVITRSQFAMKYGTRTVPSYWAKRGFNDWARTKTARHANVAGFLATSAQNTALPGMTFLYDCMSFEAGTEADDVARRILETLSPTVTVQGRVQTWEAVLRAHVTREGIEGFVTDPTKAIAARRDVLAKVIPALVKPILSAQKMNNFRGSHEQNNGALKVYREVYGLPFVATNPGSDGGLELLNHVMQIDRTKPHPFKPDRLGEDGLYELGFSRFFLVVEDGMEREPQANNPAALHDSDLARYQLARWRNIPVKLTETGEIERGPMKMLDDFGNGLQMVTHDGLPTAVPLTGDERFDAENPQMTVEQIQADIASGARSPNAFHARDVAKREFEEKHNKPAFASPVAARHYRRG